MRYRSLLALMFSLLLVATPGCGSKHPDIVPVSGTVTIDGKPLTLGAVTVSPQGHRPSTGTIDENGRFILSCFEPGDGVLKGTHLATVAAVEAVSENSNRWHAPKEYANRIKSGLWVTIDGPTDDLKIELTWAKSGKEKAPFVDKF
jgi:hypothetical protein